MQKPPNAPCRMAAASSARALAYASFTACAAYKAGIDGRYIICAAVDRERCACIYVAHRSSFIDHFPSPCKVNTAGRDRRQVRVADNI